MQRAWIGYRDPATREVVYVEAGTTDPRVAEALRVKVERERERKRPRGAKSLARVAWNAWLADLKRRGRAEDTIDAYREKLGALVRAHGERPLSSWTAAMVEAYARPEPAGDGSPAPPRAPATVRAIIQTATSWFAWCVDHHLPVAPGVLDDLRAMERPRVPIDDRPALPIETVLRMADLARGGPLEIPVVLAGLAGLALGDIRTLRWDEVDLEAATMVRRRGRRKTGQVYRAALHARVVEALRGAKDRAPEGTELVCDLGEGGNVGRALRALYAAAGAPREKGDGWHRLRHAFGTAMAAAGADVATVGAALGHAPGSAITLRYIHADAGRMRAAVDRLGEKPKPTPGG